jgi:hypothetical protein
MGDRVAGVLVGRPLHAAGQPVRAGPAGGVLVAHPKLERSGADRTGTLTSGAHMGKSSQRAAAVSNSRTLQGAARWDGMCYVVLVLVVSVMHLVFAQTSNFRTERMLMNVRRIAVWCRVTRVCVLTGERARARAGVLHAVSAGLSQESSTAAGFQGQCHQRHERRPVQGLSPPLPDRPVTSQAHAEVYGLGDHLQVAVFGSYLHHFWLDPLQLACA